MDGIYRTNICGVDVAFYAPDNVAETDIIVEKVREQIRNIMGDGKVSVPKAALIACLDMVEENNKLKTENERLSFEIDRLTSEIRQLSVCNTQMKEELEQR